MRDECAHLVLVDISTEFDDETVRMLFQGGLFEGVEGIGPDQYQVKIGVQATNEGEAYRKAVDVVQSLLSANDHQPSPIVLGATVYPPSMDDGTDPVTFS